MSESRPTIEREKIRHRRPNDMRLDDGSTPVSRHPLVTEEPDGSSHQDYVFPDEQVYQDDGLYVDEANHLEETSEDWSREPDEAVVFSSWDDESEGDWELNPELGDGEPSFGRPRPHGDQTDLVVDEDEDGGVIWEDDEAASRTGFDHPDEIAFGDQRSPMPTDPEVELAGRRDIRPKPPRPAQSQRPQAQRSQAPNLQSARPQPMRPAAETRPPRQQPRARQSQFQDELVERPVGPPPLIPSPLIEDDTPPLIEEDIIVEPGRRPGASAPAAAPGPASEVGHFSRPRGPSGMAPGSAMGRDEEVLQQPRQGGAAPRRRQAHPTPGMPSSLRPTAARRGKGWSKGLIAAVALVLAIVAGGLAYLASGLGDGHPMVDRLTSILPLNGSNRTAADTSFGNQEAQPSVSAEQAISDLEQRIQQQNGGVAASGQAASDPAANRVDGPPVPKFKPLPGATRSLTAPQVDTGGARLAANGGEPVEGESGEPSLIEQLWRYINPG